MKNRNIKEYGAYSELRTKLFLRIVLMALISIGIIGFLYICILQGRFANWIVAIFQKFFHLDFEHARQYYYANVRNYIDLYFAENDEKYLMWFLHYYEPVLNNIATDIVQRYAMYGHFADIKQKCVTGI